jgi:hypothetical protein
VTKAESKRTCDNQCYKIISLFSSSGTARSALKRWASSCLTGNRESSQKLRIPYLSTSIVSVVVITMMKSRRKTFSTLNLFLSYKACFYLTLTALWNILLWIKTGLVSDPIKLIMYLACFCHSAFTWIYWSRAAMIHFLALHVPSGVFEFYSKFRNF